MIIQINGIECNDVNDAMGQIDADDPSDRRRAISIGNKVLVVQPQEADRLERIGVCFAYLHDHAMPDGTYRIVTVPVND